MQNLTKFAITLLFIVFISLFNLSEVSANSTNQEIFYGVALKDKTNVYEKNSINSKALKSYSKGSILKYRSYSSDWYEATIYLNEKPHVGFIYAKDVETATNNPTTYKGIGLESSTKVYQSASTNSKVLKSYPKGSILKYQSFTKNWYKATVYINGEKNTGYIYASHVENSIVDQKTLRGIGLKSKTNVYERASTSSKVLKSYNEGSVLKYRTFSNDWYEATVYINGKKNTGYIYKEDVENAVESQSSLKGVALKDKTNVYASASTNSKVLKSYKHGSILVYKTFTSNWYEAKVYINGEAQTGYIHQKHVDKIVNNQGEKLEGRAIKRPTNVYSIPSTSSKVLKSYQHGSLLKFEALSSKWYKATVYINGKPQTGYIYKNDVTLGDVTIYTNYPITFSDFIDIQMTKSPKADGAGTILASRELVEYFANPSNFKEGTKEFFQFLDLSQSAGLTYKEINDKILKNQGILDGTGKAFIDASKKYSINEAYLLAHALHETGNGTSDLAKGLPVDKNGNITRDSKGNIAKTSDTYKTVYNVYGIGAFDETPLESGAKKAFNEKWFTIEDAIIGGAAFIGEDYIKKGQNTLYKMRWNPDNPGVHQYATHVEWAVAQTSRIYNIYQMVDNYILIFDVPKFKSQPKATDKPSTPQIISYPSNVYGKVTGVETNLNFRKEPSTSAEIIGSIPKDEKLQILGKHNNGWYKVIYNNKQGYVSGEYITLLNLLEIIEPSLNVRSEPIVNDSTQVGGVGSAHGIQFVAAVLNSKDQLVTNNEWYQIYYNNKKYWISGGENGTEYVKIIK